MPSNIVHMLICHKAIERLNVLVRGLGDAHVRNRLDSFLGILENENLDCDGSRLRAYFNLGSLGPDIFCYRSFREMAAVVLGSGPQGAIGAEPLAYHCHSSRPNEFPLKLLEIFFRDLNVDGDGNFAIGLLEAQDKAKLAFIAGYVTHIAADQVIHPLVNAYAGPYYRLAANRAKHRHCEILQDFFLYQCLYGNKSGERYDFFRQNFGSWVDCITGIDADSGGLSQLGAVTRVLASGIRFKEEAASHYRLADWFEGFIDRAFAETYGIKPAREELRDSVFWLMEILTHCNARNSLLPYWKARQAWIDRFADDGGYRGDFKEAFHDLDYLRRFREAVELAAVYIIALFEAFNRIFDGKRFGARARRRFLKIVSDADLVTPLTGTPLGGENSILDTSIQALWRGHDGWQTDLDLDTSDEIGALVPVIRVD